ncbi:hypothetical protein ACETRY_05780 [Cronobacter malonaticus]|uniref:Uncharacterized protein n=1 Tax=Cronobacter malonaticus TaxID=413503 RepID=A0A423Y1E5_9ENTR|nr:hypothetical protein [Cronobacter malonaticus]ROW63338.1 hypothetical protein C3E80_05260 [Cronobacter malonaticus]RRA42809.1 hypothetical protein C4882_03165 [Cronobacter malonaticus]
MYKARYAYSFHFYRHACLAIHYPARLDKNDSPQELKNKLIDGLAFYLTNGYIDPYYFNPDCEDEGSEETDRYLSKLDMVDKEASMYFRKKIVESTFIKNGLFKSFCLDRLLLSDDHRSYAMDYLVENHTRLSLHPLRAAMFHLICAKNVPPNDIDIPAELISALKSRYEKIIEENGSARYRSLSTHEIYSDFELFELNTEYEDFCKAWP